MQLIMTMKMFLKTRNIIKCLRCKHNWIQPNGFNTGVKVYNCIIKQKIPLIVSNKHFVTWYTCGPTVYDSSHIGHASCYVRLDIIQRILRKHYGLNVVTVMNITDIDDKIIQRSKARNIPIADLTKIYEEEFWRDMDMLKVKRPDIVARVTEQMPKILAFIGKLISNNQAYVAEDGSVYFDVSACANYGKLQTVSNFEQVKESANFKRSQKDFALWKSTPDEPAWESNWGKGRPGWHIECSTIASDILGSSIDIHAGGIDLRFPHHENEEAQSCAYFSQPQWVNYWLHTGHLAQKNAIKMSKSLKNTISIEDLLKSHTADAFRMACLMTHYRSHMEFSDALMQTAASTLQTYKNFLANMEALKSHHIKGYLDHYEALVMVSETSKEIHQAFADDFNTPAVIRALNNLISKINKQIFTLEKEKDTNKVSIVIIVNFISNVLELLGLTEEKNEESQDYCNVIEILNDFRSKVRNSGIKNKNKELLSYCDQARDSLKKRGIVVTDYKERSTWARK